MSQAPVLSDGNAWIPSYRQGVALVLFAGTCWSAMPLGIRYLERAEVWQILFYRSLSLTPFLFGVIAWRSGSNPLAQIREAGSAAVLGALCLVVAYSGGVFAIQRTSAANAMFLFASTPLFAALLGRLLLGEGVRRMTWIAMAIAALGIAVMVLESVSAGEGFGNLMALISALGFALFTVVLRWKKRGEMLPVVLLSGVFSIPIAALFCQVSGQSLVLPAQDVAISLALGAFQLGLGLAIYTIGSKAVPAAELALLAMVEVLLGPFWVWLVLGEGASAYTLVGGGILLGAIAGNALSGWYGDGAR